MMRWSHAVTGFDGNCQLFNVNIFDYEWKSIGKRINVKDPAYQQNHTFEIWKVEINDIEYEFAAGEFSNCVWGFYLPTI